LKDGFFKISISLTLSIIHFTALGLHILEGLENLIRHL